MNRLAVFFILFALTISAKAQLGIANTKLLPGLKGKTTYVVVDNDTTSEEAQLYMSFFKKYWTFSVPKFITIDEAKNYYQEGNSFVSMSIKVSKNFGNNMHGSLSTRSWSFWVCNKKVVKNSNPFYSTDIAYFHLTTEYETYGFDSFRYMAPKEAFAYFYPAVAKNTIQQANYFLEKGQEITLKTPPIETAELSKLKTSTLLIPENFFEARIDTAAFLKNYPFKSEVIVPSVLDDKILSATEDFYYLHLGLGGRYKLLSVVNGNTGQIIYGRWFTVQPAQYLTKRDLELLVEAIGKK